METPTKVPGAVLFALSPGDPNDAWVYLFHYDGPPSASLRAAKRNVPKRGGVITGEQPTTVDGHPATRRDFTFRDGTTGRATATEWFLSDGHGRTFVLAVGHRAGDANVAERFVDAFAL